MTSPYNEIEISNVKYIYKSVWNMKNPWGFYIFTINTPLETLVEYNNQCA